MNDILHGQLISVSLLFRQTAVPPPKCTLTSKTRGDGQVSKTLKKGLAKEEKSLDYCEIKREIFHFNKVTHAAVKFHAPNLAHESAISLL